MRKVSIIGVGRVGGALAIALSREGFTVENLFVRNDETARKIVELINPPPEILTLEQVSAIDSEIIFVAAQDSEIENVAKLLSEKKMSQNCCVFHTSGSISSKILRALKSQDCAIGSIHPLVSVSDAVLGAERFADAYFCLEGDAKAVETAQKIVGKLGGKSFSIETKYKTLYHAAAVTACGHLVALIDVATKMLEKCGLNEADSKDTLLPLIKSTIENLEVQTTAEALTGTFARADVGTFEKHLAAFDENSLTQAKEIYLQLGEHSAHLAQRQGANAENLREILTKISLAKNNFKC